MFIYTYIHTTTYRHTYIHTYIVPLAQPKLEHNRHLVNRPYMYIYTYITHTYIHSGSISAVPAWDRRLSKWYVCNKDDSIFTAHHCSPAQCLQTSSQMICTCSLHHILHNCSITGQRKQLPPQFWALSKVLITHKREHIIIMCPSRH